MTRTRAALVSLAILAGCTGKTPDPAIPPDASVPAPAAATATVTGTVFYRERIMLPPEALLTVRLSDVSRADAAAMLIAEQKITPVRVPAAFSLAYDPASIDPTHTYVVQARIEQDGKLLFLNTQQFQVITRESPVSGVEVLVQGVDR